MEKNDVKNIVNKWYKEHIHGHFICFKDNDESTISKKQDTWTFQKKINSNSPIWLLSST